MPLHGDKIVLPLDGSEPVDILIEQFPNLLVWLRDQGLGCFQCGEIYWGPLIDLYRTTKRTSDGFEMLLSELNGYLAV